MKVRKRMQSLVLIRSSGERTSEATFLELQKISDSSTDIEVSKEENLWRHMVNGFSRAASEQYHQILFVDADVIPIAEMVKEFLKAGLRNSRVFVSMPLVLCHLYDFPRVGGLHLYNADYSQQSLKVLQQFKDQLRPESTLISHMSEMGYKRSIYSEVLGIHDYFQNPSDYYRKGFLHAGKHESHLQYLESVWRKAMPQEYSYKFLLEGAYFYKKIGRPRLSLNSLNKLVQDSPRYQEILRENVSIEINVLPAVEVLRSYREPSLRDLKRHLDVVPRQTFFMLFKVSRKLIYVWLIFLKFFRSNNQKIIELVKKP